MLKADGFNAAIIGVDNAAERIVYDKHKMIEILIILLFEELTNYNI